MSNKMYNVSDNRRSWIGEWTTEPLVAANLTPADIGRTVIYSDKTNRREAGTLTSYRLADPGSATGDTVWARYSRGDTAAGSNAEDLCFGIEPLDGPALIIPIEET